MQNTSNRPYTLTELKEIIGAKSYSEHSNNGSEIRSHVFSHIMDESSRSFFTITDYSQMRYLFVSPGAEMVTGHPSKMFECGGIEFMLGLLHPEEGELLRRVHEKIVSFFNAIPASDKLNYSYCYNMRILKADGTYIRLLCQLDGKELDGFHQLVIGKETYTDVTLYDHNPGMTLGIYCHLQTSGTSSVLYRFDFTNPSEALTKREKEIQDMVNQGFTSKEIAERLCLSKHTVDTHRRRIKKK